MLPVIKTNGSVGVCVFQGCMPNGCCRSDSGKLIADHHYPRDTYVSHDGRVASCSLLNSSTYCSSHRVCDTAYSSAGERYDVKRKCIDFKCV